MAETYLNLLNSAQQVTSDAFGKIDRAMTLGLEVQNRAQQQEVNVRLKALDFAEGQRQHDIQVDQINYQNAAMAQQVEARQFYMQKDFELKSQLLPLQKQSALLGVQAQAWNAKRQQEALNSQQFNSITATYDERMGYDILRTESEDQAKDYLALKGKYQSIVANGGNFDSKAFEGEMNQIATKYKDATPSESGWNPGKQYLFDNVSPKLGQAFQLKNPVVSRNRNGMASTYYDMPDNQVADFAGKFGSLYTSEDWGGLGSGRTIYQNNKRKIEEFDRAASSLESKLALGNGEEADPIKVSGIQKQAQEYRTQARTLQEQNTKLQSDAAQGKYGVHIDEAVPTPTPSPSATKEYNLSDFLDGKNTIGFPAQKDEQGKGMAQRLAVLQTTLSPDGEVDELRDVKNDGGLAWYAKNRIAPDRKSMETIRSRIEGTIESLGNIEDRFTPERVNNIISQIKSPASVPISAFTKEAIQDNYGWDLSQRNPLSETSNVEKQKEEFSINFGPKSSTAGRYVFGTGHQIESFTDIQKILHSIPKAERDEAQKEIYAALLTAVISQALNPEK